MIKHYLVGRYSRPSRLLDPIAIRDRIGRSTQSVAKLDPVSCFLTENSSFIYSE